MPELFSVLAGKVYCPDDSAERFLCSKWGRLFPVVSGRLVELLEDPHSPAARLFLHYGDLTSGEQLTNLVYNHAPAEIYHLGAQSHVLPVCEFARRAYALF